MKYQLRRTEIDIVAHPLYQML